MRRVILIVGCLVASSAVADTWRCPGGKGRPVYQDQPCADAMYGNGKMVGRNLSFMPPPDAVERESKRLDALTETDKKKELEQWRKMKKMLALLSEGGEAAPAKRETAKATVKPQSMVDMNAQIQQIARDARLVR